MKEIDTKQKAALVTGGAFAAAGAAIISLASNPVAWGVLAYATYRVAKSAYRNAQENKTKETEEDSLFH